MSKLISGIKEFYVSFIKEEPEKFKNKSKHNENVAGLIIGIILVVILQVLIGKFIWNEYIVRIIPAFKPVKSYADILALFIMAALLF